MSSGRLYNEHTYHVGTYEMTGQEKTGMILRVLLVEDCEDDTLLLEHELTQGG